MKALRYFGERDIRHDSMDDPKLESDRDAIVQMTACSICGSDLHIYHGHGFSEDTGFCVGHEAVGEVVEIGRAVTRVKVGDKVMMPAAVGCGACRSCLSGVVNTCENNASGCYGLSARLQGVQAEAFRVPAADMNAVKIPDGISEDQALDDDRCDGDRLVRRAQRRYPPGQQRRRHRPGPDRLDDRRGRLRDGRACRLCHRSGIPERRALAEAVGAIALHPDEAMERIKEDTKGSTARLRGRGGRQRRNRRFRAALRTGARDGVGDRRTAIPPLCLSRFERAFAGGLTFRVGTCSVPEELPALFPLVQSGRLKPERYISHRLPLEPRRRCL
jgi:threonine dehydrogenase-like Zn-dependent dehydrogenase